jgi:hypothetical protein
VDGKLVTSDTYIAAEIHWTNPDVAEFRTIYQYPLKINGKTIFENRLTRLHFGERLFEVSSFFTSSAARSAKPIEGFPYEVAIGLVTQNRGAQIKFDPEHGFASVYEPLDGKGLGTGVILPKAQFLRSVELPAADKAGKNAQAIIITRPDSDGRVHYRAGFAWAGDGDIISAEQWLNYLAKQAAR